MKCKQCDLEKDTTEFYKTKSKSGIDKVCKLCRAENNKNRKENTSKYQNPRHGYIQPTHPIPIKLTTMDGFGGYYRFDFDKLKLNLDFAKSHGQKNHMVNRKFKCWQVKSVDLSTMQSFCNAVNMSNDAIIKFDKSDNSVYVVNLYHPGILKVMR